MPSEPRFSWPPGVVVVVAHPDDEAIGAGAQLPRLERGTFVVVTDGAPRDMRDAHALGIHTSEAYAAARRAEMRRALALAGIGPERVRHLGVADQGASHQLPALVELVASILQETVPNLVLTHAYEGGHPDHDATAFAVHAACRRLARSPVIMEMTSYHAGAEGMRTGEFLPWPGITEHACTLTPRERAFKARLFECYATQRAVLTSFAMDVERFRRAPSYDFQAPPHDGPLFYERFDWGVTGVEWRQLARQAMDGCEPAVRENYA